MRDDEKEVYSLIFLLALKLREKPELKSFARDMAVAAGGTKETLMECWELLKKNGGVRNTPECDENWEAIVEDADRISRSADEPTSKAVAAVLVELERRARA